MTVQYLTLEAAAGPRASRVECKEALALSSLSPQDRDMAISQSRLLQTMNAEASIPFPSSLIQKWLAVAAGGDCDADAAVDVLRVALFLQDEDTYARLISTVSAVMARGFEASRYCGTAQEWWRRQDGGDLDAAVMEPGRLSAFLTVQADDDDAGCLEVLKDMHPRAACMHPHDRFRALGALPLPIISRLPQPIQIEAISSFVTATATQAAGSWGRTRATASPGPSRPPLSGFCDASASPPPAPALVLDGIRCGDIARLGFNAALLPAQPLRSVSITGMKPCKHSKYVGCCDWTGFAIAATLRAHAASVRHFTLIGVSLSPLGGSALAAALANSQLRLDTLSLCPADECPETRGGEVAEALQTQTALTQLSITWPGCHGMWARCALDLSCFPRLCKLAVASKTPARVEWWLPRELRLKHLLRLEELDLSRAPLNGQSPTTRTPEIVAGLGDCPALRVLSVAGDCIPAAMQAARVVFPELTCMRVRLVDCERVLPMSWLRGHTRLRDIVLAAGTPQAWRSVEVNAAAFVREAAALCALTRVEMRGVRAVNCAGGWATLMRPLAQLPCLEVLRLSAVDVEAADAGTQNATPRIYNEAPSVTEAQRRWLRIFEPPPPQRSAASLTPPAELFPALRVLDLSSTGLSTTQLSMLATMPHLTHLDLAGNSLGADLRTARGAARSMGGAWLAALAQLTQLRLINLAWNDIDDDGALRVLCALGGLRQLEMVDLSQNEISDIPERCLLRDVVQLAEVLEGRAGECASAGAVVLAPVYVAIWDDSSIDSVSYLTT